jgi:hypothetical protein
MDALADTRRWMEEFVLALDLCPFARAPWRAGRVRLIESRAANEEEVLAELLHEISLLTGGPDPDTTLLVIPQLLSDADDLLDLVAAGEELLERLDLDSDVQLVGFHPAYCFDDAAMDDPAHATNRSPHPTIHLLRQDQVSRAIDAHPDIDAIARRNMALLRARAEE